MEKYTLNNLLIILNIAFFLYYATQLLIYTDEFATNNIGFFNHAVAGLCELLGIIFLSFAIVSFIFFKNLNQIPLLILIFLIQTLIALNLWRYVFTNSPGESNIDIIQINAIIFSLAALNILIILIRKNNK